MGIVTANKIVCDNCNTAEVSLDSFDSPLPNTWMRCQGYVNIGGGDSVSLNSYCCPGCIAAQGTRALVKKTADLTNELQ